MSLCIQAYKGILHPNLVPLEYLGPKHSPRSPKLSRAVMPTSDDLAPSSVPTTTVAIKVLHPKMAPTIRRDLKIMMFFAKALNTLPGMSWLSLPDEVRVFGDMMMSQLDLRVEASNLDRFETNFRHRRTISFPRALGRYTSRQALVEEYEDAIPLKAFLGEENGPFDQRIANLGLDGFLVSDHISHSSRKLNVLKNMLLLDNFCHADLHPGNIMVKVDPSLSPRPRAVF